MIRLAEEKDYKSVLELAKSFCEESKYPLPFDEGTFLHSFRQSLTSPDLILIVYEVDGDIKGFLAGLITKTLFSSRPVSAELAWYVTPSYRGSMAGIRLVKAYETWASNRGCTILSLTNINGLGNLDDMYVKMGYTLTEKTYIKEI